MNNEKIAEFLQKPLQEAFDTECRCYEIYLKAYESMLETWKKLEKNWNSKYFPNLNIKVKTNLKIDATGSLLNTIKEDK